MIHPSQLPRRKTSTSSRTFDRSDPMGPSDYRTYEKSHEEMLDCVHMIDSSTSKSAHVDEVMAYKKRTDKILAIFRMVLSTPSEELSPEIFDPIEENLDLRDIPDETTRQFKAILSLELVHKSLRILWLCRRHFMFSEPLLYKAVSLWPKIWAWLRYLIQDVVERGLWGVDIAKMGLGCFASTIETFAPHFSLQQAMINTPGSWELLTHYWMVEDTLGPLDIQKREDIFTRAFPLTLFRSTMHPHFQEVIYAANGRKNIARITLRRLRTETERPYSSFDAERTFSLITTVKACCDHYDPELQSCFLAEGSLVATVKLIAVLNARRLKSAEAKRQEVSCVSMCYIHILIGGKCSKHGHLWLMQAIKSGLIHAALGSAKFAKYLSDQDIKHLMDVFDLVLFPSTTYRGVTETIAQYLEENPVRPDDVPRLMRDKWSQFLALFEGRKKGLAVVTRDALGQCWSCKAHSSTTNSAVKECKGCFLARYCSPACQRMHWPVHKADCKVARLSGGFIQAKDKTYIRPTFLDTAHMLWIVGWELRSRMAELNTILRQRHRGLPLKHLLFYLDCTATPAKLYVVQNTEMSNVDRLVTEKRRSDSEAGFIVEDDTEYIFVQLAFHWEYEDGMTTGFKTLMAAPRGLGRF